jgi:uncharacterized protein
MIEMELSRILIRDGEEGQVVVLKEKDGTRSFPIFIGTFEASIIDRYVREIEFPRPLTHDLLVSTIRQLGGRLERIVITDLRDKTFYALLYIMTDKGLVQVDSRPSDALCLAAAIGADIYAEEHVIEMAVSGEDLA